MLETMSSQPLRVRVQTASSCWTNRRSSSRARSSSSRVSKMTTATSSTTRRALHSTRELELSVEDFKAGRVHSADEVMAELRARAQK